MSAAAALPWWNALTGRARADEPCEASNGSQPQPIVLVIEPVDRKGRFVGKIDGQPIVTSRQPFLDAARQLLKRGHDPATPYNMRHANSDVLSFVTTTIGHAAGLSVHDSPRARFRKPSPSARIRKFENTDEPLDKAAESIFL